MQNKQVKDLSDDRWQIGNEKYSRVTGRHSGSVEMLNVSPVGLVRNSTIYARALVSSIFHHFSLAIQHRRRLNPVYLVALFWHGVSCARLNHSSSATLRWLIILLVRGSFRLLKKPQQQTRAPGHGRDEGAGDKSFANHPRVEQQQQQWVWIEFQNFWQIKMWVWFLIFKFYFICCYCCQVVQSQLKITVFGVNSTSIWDKHFMLGKSKLMRLYLFFLPNWTFNVSSINFLIAHALNGEKSIWEIISILMRLKEDFG